ncbi:Swi3-domain-containing protein [Xylariaceae sp. FL0016]|nr:Swi3-domain-containing protein [Xylariaceae sp. FL0016]
MASGADARPLNNTIDPFDIDDDPFASEDERDRKKNENTQSKKRKETNGLGIDEEVLVKKKPRVPNVKLDEARLLSEKGIPRLRRKARDLKFKGKGHEFGDTARLLSFYQLWLDDLFPKAKFLDALNMVEKTGHKKYMRIKRLEWIDEGRPKPSVTADEDDLFGDSNEAEEREAAVFPARVAPIFQTQNVERSKTPVQDDLFGDDEDIYNATPKRSKTTAPTNSMFGNGGQQDGGEPDEDDLDALMAEEEAQRTATTSIFGNGNSNNNKSVQQGDEPDEDDLDALMAEAEAERQPKPVNQTGKPKPKSSHPFLDDDEDDLDALMAESEVHDQEQTKQPMSEPRLDQKDATNVQDNVADQDEEAAMAEMDGLW